ncbi:hypothetical protein KHM19_27480 [Leptospira borgpetersenii]|uniref:Type ISP restriction-modification enzyme LLaBIII C-terminal specificity domain-containing protein n=3 Tax=Leptospira borgpetersenii TaxID=174 RepID=M3FII6_LEPBO|nr:hypothetical protein LEP1GSC128_4116 [Leptospira borgpetersenii str. 200801926]EKQ91359.1 hypothetical protein LEP1GSC101_1383 [Leptospira borgpetersenii str. UI 09149]EMG01628.1 hypothetical protein LEP1GSC123_3995 [Leptospira borgpetersenii str. 200701203]EMK10989.1 hypothetical protein LEP1GSC066_2649 [Leptospira sp. serovar Kenya str. Sh9]EMN58988.1 hypothetical protein LEP1GSC090_2944 [Leptospira borgpetersenii serovar Javanica str. MK146]ENO64459.1 hypothetical protein LEP1GSC191_0809
MIQPDQHNDWINQRDNSFGEFISIRDKKDTDSLVIFNNYSQGVKTNRDAWVYDSNESILKKKIKLMIDFYNSEVDRYRKACVGLTNEKKSKVEDFINNDSTKMSWTHEVKNDLANHKTREFQVGDIVPSIYRPFVKQWMYFNKHFNNRVYQMPRIFPDAATENLVICITGLGETKGFTPLITDMVPNLHFVAGSHASHSISTIPMRLKLTPRQKTLFLSLQNRKNPNQKESAEMRLPMRGLPIFKKNIWKKRLQKKIYFTIFTGFFILPNTVKNMRTIYPKSCHVYSRKERTGFSRI